MMNQAKQLPVPHDTWDANTFNPNLPHGNDVTPPVQEPPGLDGPTMGRVAGEFRMHAQQRCGRGPLYTVVYNLFAQNYFQNPFYIEWLQRAMDFTEYLVVAQGDNPQSASTKATLRIYRAALAVVANEFPQLLQGMDQGLIQELNQAGQIFQDIQRDLAAFIQNGRRVVPNVGGYQQPQGGYAPQQGYQQPHGGGYQPPQYGQQLPPVTHGPGGQAPGGYGPQARPSGPMPNQLASNMAPSGSAPNQQPMGPAPSGTPLSPTREGGRYFDEPAQPAQPQSQPQPQSWTAGQPLSSAQGGSGSMHEIKAPNFGGAEQLAPQHQHLDTELPVPRDVSEVKIDPYYYIPSGESVDPHRPYDMIYIPGGAEARPAHLSGWTRTRSAEHPYALGYDPQQFILFHVRWPDGVVHEKVVEFDMENMSYLRHEIDTQLRGEAIQPDGKVVASHYKITDMDKDPAPVEKVREKLDAGLAERDALRPVILEGLFTASTDLENEEEAQKQLIDQLGLLEEETDRLPPHEYVSARVFPLTMSKEGQDRLRLLATSDTLPALATGLSEAVNDGELSRRYFRLLNQRFTRMINTTLKDNLSLESVAIDDFVADITDLMDYLTDNYGPELVQVIDSQTPSLLRRWMSLRFEELDDAEENEEVLYLVDEYINLQLPWTTEQLASLNLSEEPVLISNDTHPKVTRVIRETMGRHGRDGTLHGRYLRLLTADGQYLEALRGWLVSDAVLIKQV